jgi:hypothetical protein
MILAQPFYWTASFGTLWVFLQPEYDGPVCIYVCSVMYFCWFWFVVSLVCFCSFSIFCSLFMTLVM